MKYLSTVILFALFFQGCSNTEDIKIKSETKEIQVMINQSDLEEKLNVKDVPEEIRSFKNVDYIIRSQQYSSWVKILDSNSSLALHFNLDLDSPDTLAVSYSAECWLKFPFEIDRNKIKVYWDKLIDTKYNFDLVKAMERVEEEYIGKSFMVLELVNDTTLKATYPIPDLVKKINSSSMERIFLPDKFYLNHGFFL